jgi:3-oxoacyl-[acyl-carrier-protein] synthase II
MRRVVVTGLGAVTPLGVGKLEQASLLKILKVYSGVRNSWRRLIAGETGIGSTRDSGPEFASIPSQVAGFVPTGTREEGGWNAADWLDKRVISLLVVRSF